MIGRAAVFLDRDGTLNVERNYLYRVADFELVPGAAEAVALLNQSGRLAIVVTNQAGIARGLYDAAAVDVLHGHLQAVLREHGAHIDAFYFCPHHPEFTGQCDCRKPRPGMLLAAAADHAVDLGRSWLVGDTLGDLGAGQAAGCRTILVRTGYGTRTEAELLASSVQPAAVVDDVLAAVRFILADG
jgi:D-glycero-D-manno-heptose 1,7-bisphosphate phosphatase